MKLRLTGLLTPEYSLDDGVTWQTLTNPIRLGSLASGSSAAILIRSTVSTSAADSIINTVTVSSSAPDPNPDNNSAIVITPIHISTDLAIIKTADQDTVKAGDVLTYTLTATNSGPNPAQGVTMMDEIPGELLAPEFSLDGGITWQSWNSSYSFNSLTSGSSTAILIRGTVSQKAEGVIANTAAISSLTPDPNPENNSSVVLTPVGSEAELGIVKISDHRSVQAGDVLTYTLLAVNHGPDEAVDVTIFDQVPDDLTDIQYSLDNGLTWRSWQGVFTFSTLAVEDEQTILIRGTVSSSAAGVIANTAAISSPTPDPGTGNNSSTVLTPVEALADLSITKTSDKRLVQSGEIVTYTLIAANHGPDPADESRIIDEIPADLLAPEFSLDGGITWQPWTGANTLEHLDADSSVMIFIRGTVSSKAFNTLTNTATISSPVPDPESGNNRSTAEIQIRTPGLQKPLETPDADLCITKTARTNCVFPGSHIIYTLIVSNQGTADARQVEIKDPLPVELYSGQYSLDQGKTWHPWEGSLKLGTIAAGASVRLLLYAKVRRCAYGKIVNCVEVTTSTPERDLSNNQSRITTRVDSGR